MNPLACAALACVLALGACGDDGGQAPPIPTTTSETADSSTGTTAGSDTGTAGTGDFIPMHEEDVRFPSDILELEGTLTLPDRQPDDTSAAIVLVHGSGPQGRDEVLPYNYPLATGEIRTFEDLARELGQAGFVVLRYDKRTCFSLNGCDNDYPTPSTDTLSVLDFGTDAHAALDYVSARLEVDPERLVLAGHSQGAKFVPTFLDSRDDLVAGVMLAGNFRPIDELLAWQAALQRTLAEEAGLTPAQIDAALADLDQLVSEVEQLRAGTFMGTQIGGLPVAFWLSWFDLDDQAPAIASDVGLPILVASGDYDWNVPPEETEAWGQLLDGVQRNPGHRSLVLPCLTHALNCVSDPNWLDVVPSEVEPSVSDSIIAEVVDFLPDP